MDAIMFSNRVEAGRLLGNKLREFGPFEHGLILALPRGGVPVAAEVARILNLPLDLMLVRKLGVPGHEELAMGAIATGGAVVFNEDLLEVLPIDEADIDRVTSEERRELARRQRLYRGDREEPRLEDRTIILVDDGLATGATMRAAIAALKQNRPKRIVVAAAVAPRETVASLRMEAHDVVCLATPEPFMGVGRWYTDFSQTTDAEVQQLLGQAWSKGRETS